MGRQSRIVFGVVAVALLALLTVFAVELIDSQAKGRRDVENRFSDRAAVSAAMTASLFQSTSRTAQAENARRYGAARVSPRTLARQAQQSRLRYLMVLSADGRIIAASPGTSPAAKRAVAAKPAYVREALRDRPYALSGVQGAGTPRASLGFAQRFKTRFGQRIVVSGFVAKLLYDFIGGYLAQIPNRRKSARAYVLDRRGAIVGSPEKGRRPGEIVQDPGLLAALAGKGDNGSYGDDRYFAADAVPGSPWRVVVTASRDELFAPEGGARKWVPWILFVAFGLAAVFALVLVRRVLRDAAKVAAVNAQLGRANRALERRASELTRSNEELELFASIASHDLQEPLRKVRTFAERMTRSERDGLSDRGREYLAGMDSAAGRMQDLIEDLLAFSRIATTTRPPEQVQLTEVADEVVADLGAVIEHSGATVEVGRLPAVLADPTQMRQLLQNLISNALKFSRDGVQPVVEVEGRVRGDLAEIRVSDNGIGIEPRHVDRIFKVFERLHGRETYAGTGIGLALCRRVVERHGGTIRVESTPGVGSTFIATLARQPLDEPSEFGIPDMPPTKEEQPLVPA